MQGRWIGMLGVLLLAVVTPSCASRLQGSVSYDEYANFSRYQTFAFAQENPTLKQAPDNVREARAVARREIESQLREKGYRFVERDEASLLIRFRMGTHQRVTSQNATTGTMAGMQIEFADPKQVSVVWRGWAHLTWRESMDRDSEIANAVAFILKQYPPDSGSG